MPRYILPCTQQDLQVVHKDIHRTADLRLNLNMHGPQSLLIELETAERP
ncbi:hypothetical protein [Pseudomonas sp. Marseille-QA0892]